MIRTHFILGVQLSFVVCILCDLNVFCSRLMADIWNDGLLLKLDYTVFRRLPLILKQLGRFGMILQRCCCLLTTQVSPAMCLLESWLIKDFVNPVVNSASALSGSSECTTLLIESGVVPLNRRKSYFIS